MTLDEILSMRPGKERNEKLREWANRKRVIIDPPAPDGLHEYLELKEPRE